MKSFNVFVSLCVQTEVSQRPLIEIPKSVPHMSNPTRACYGGLEISHSPTAVMEIALSWFERSEKENKGLNMQK